MTKTRINSVGKHSKSLRSVIPHWIVELMELSKDNSFVSKMKVKNIDFQKATSEKFVNLKEKIKKDEAKKTDSKKEDKKPKPKPKTK